MHIMKYIYVYNTDIYVYVNTFILSLKDCDVSVRGQWYGNDLIYHESVSPHPNPLVSPRVPSPSNPFVPLQFIPSVHLVTFALSFQTAPHPPQNANLFPLKTSICCQGRVKTPFCYMGLINSWKYVRKYCLYKRKPMQFLT